MPSSDEHGQIYLGLYIGRGAAVAQLVEALRYKLAGRGFDSRCCHWLFFFFCGTMALGSTQPLTEMSARSISWGVNAAGADG
jgi:hypothetical protein